MDELEEAIDRSSMGLERRSRVMSPKEQARVASHEMGHALVAHYSENLDPVHRITIIPRGTAALGLTMTRPLEDRFLATEPELKDTLAYAMGGRVAEELVYGEISTGAQNDLEKATQIARAMVTEYGMSEKVGPLSLGHEDPNAIFGSGPRISSGTAEKIDEEVNRLLERGARPGRAPADANTATCSTSWASPAGGRDDRRRRPRGLHLGTKPIPDRRDAPSRRGAREGRRTPRRRRGRQGRPRARSARVAGIGSLPPAPPMPTID